MNTLIKILQLAIQFIGALVLLRIMTEYEYGIYSALLQTASLVMLIIFSPFTIYSFNTYSVDQVLAGQLLSIYRLLCFILCLIAGLFILTVWSKAFIVHICFTIFLFSTNLYQFSLAYMSVSLSLRKSILINLYYFVVIVIIAFSLFFVEFNLTAVQYVLILVVLQVFLSSLMFRELNSCAINRGILTKMRYGRSFIRGQVYISILNWIAFQLPKIAILPLFNTEDYGAFMKIMLLPITGIGAVEAILHATFIPKFFREKQVRKDGDKSDFMLFTLLICGIGCVGMYFAEVVKTILLPQGLNTVNLMAFGFGLEIARSILNYTIIDGYRNNSPDKYQNGFFAIIAISAVSILLAMIHNDLFIYITLLYVATLFYVPYFIVSKSLIHFDKTLLLCGLPIVAAPILSSLSFNTFTWSLIFFAILLYELCVIFNSRWRPLLFQYLRFN